MNQCECGLKDFSFYRILDTVQFATNEKYKKLIQSMQLLMFNSLLCWGFKCKTQLIVAHAVANHFRVA